MESSPTDNKLIIYQLLPRLYGNTKQVNKTYGSIEENGVGKFNDINDKALQEIKKMGFAHVGFQGDRTYYYDGLFQIQYQSR